MKISVLGAGIMGHGIAQVAALGGHEVTIRDIEMKRVDEGIQAIRENIREGIERGKVESGKEEVIDARITGTTDLETAVSGCDLVIEAVPEDMDLKRQVLEEVEPLVSPDVVIATNTSSLSVTDLASSLNRPERMIGLHFFNPPYLMELVEVIEAEQSDDTTVEFAEGTVDDFGKTPILVRDSPGFATSRLGVTLGAEAMRMLETGVADARDIDRAMELGYNHPMGPLELTDVVGLDTRLEVLEYLREELGERFRPPQILKRKVRAGRLGQKTGEGFYRWENGEIIDPEGDNQ